jgi:phospholipid/cholesterol/gamma-HCH transport system substrate-binding protein
MRPVVTLLAVLVVGALVVVQRGGEDPYVVRAVVEDSAGLRKNSDVKVGGVPGGTVKKLELTRDDRALVTMELDPETVPVGAGARAHVRPVNLLGEKYVDLDVGELHRPQPSGTTIPLARTGVAVELDDVLNMLTPDTRGALRILINEAGVSMAGAGADFNGLLDELPPALDKVEDLLAQLGAESHTLRRLITQGDRVVGSMTGRRGDLVGLVDSAQRALDETSERRRQLGATVAAAPGALGQLRTSLRDLDATARDLTPSAALLRRSAPALTQALQALPAFAEATGPTLRTARDVAPTLTRLGRRSTPHLRRLEPTARRLATFARDVEPLTDSFDAGGAFDALLGLVDGWARTIQTSDGLGHVFRLRVQLDEELATSLLQRYGVLTPTRTKKQPTARKPSSTPPRPSRPGRPVAPKLPELPKLPDLPGLPTLDDLPVQGLADDLRDGTTGELLDYLLGD